MRAFASSPKTSAAISMGGPWPRERGRRSYRLRKYVRRHRAALLAISTIVVLLACSGGACALERTVRPGPPACRTLAVLPFQPLGHVEGDEYLGLGMTDALITQLSNLPQIAVRPTTAIQEYESKPTDAVAAGKKLQVEAVLDARFQREGDRLRLTAQLISVTSGTPLWAETLRRAVHEHVRRPGFDLAARRRNAAEDMSRKRNRGGWPARPTTHPGAYELYLRGRYQWNKRTDEGLKTRDPVFRTGGRD